MTEQEIWKCFTALPADAQQQVAVLRKAAELRVHFEIKTPDAPHLSTAESYGCTRLWMNDDRLAKVSSLTKNILRE